MDGRTSGRRTKARGIKKPDERSEKRVNRTKDEESRRGDWPDRLERNHTAQSGWRERYLEKEKKISCL